MNWFTRFFQKKTSTAAAISQPTTETKTTTEQVPESNSPIQIYKQNLNPDQLKKFIPIRDLDDECIAKIPHSTLVFHPDSVIFSRGQPAECVYYLLKGRLLMQPESDSSYEVSADTTLAALPLNSGKLCGATATALTDVNILQVSAELNQLWTRQCHQELSCVELLDIHLPEAIANQAFFNSFAQAYRSNQLRLPSLPNVAFKLKQAMQNDIGIDDAVDIIHIDPPIVAKLIQVANSPLYGSSTPITNCHDAVNRIGLNATRSLVMGISLKQLFHSADKELMKGMHAIWKSSLFVSSLSFVLAQECSSTINPEDALLAGLIADIGAIPLLHFAEQSPDQYPGLAELEASLPYLRGPVGALVLHTLGFSGDLVDIPHHAENWHYDSGEELTLTDIVILAKLHSYFGSKNAKDLPYINSIPAYAKIKDRKLDADFSLTVLHRAQHRINVAMQLLS